MTMRKQVIIRVRVIALCILFLSGGLLVRLYVVQIAHNEYYVNRAERQYVHTARELYSRGSIYFTTRDGDYVSAASVQLGSLVSFNPTEITDATSTCEALVPWLTLTLERCVNRATLPERTYVEVDSQVPKEKAEAVSALDLPGVHVYKSQWRYYPGDALSARVIGFVGFTDKSERELHGKYGLERQYDNVLIRQREVETVNLFAELFSGFGSATSTAKGRAGNIVTTIEPTVARMVDDVLHKTHTKYGSELTGAIVMNPKTGAIFAMNAVPGFNLNDRATVTVDRFANPLVESVYEFGSTIKALTVAAGLDSGAITAQSTYYDEGCIELNTKTICNFDGKGRGTVDMQQVLSQSLNTGVTHIMQKMTKERFRDYFINFKLGSETGIDLPSEAHGLLGEFVSSPREVEYATASFGQGIALTPIATTRALSVLANGGYLVTPHVVSKIEYEDGEVHEVRYPRGQHVIATSTSEEISRILTRVVDEALLKGTVALPHHTIAAKTGTAQMPDTDGGGYSEYDYLHSFFGYFPAYDPQFIVFMYTVKPQGVQYASETLTLPFMEIAEFLINYYNIPPDR